MAPELKFLTRDGVKLAYIDSGAGPQSPSVLLVHGMTGSHINMMPLYRHLAKTRRVVSVDLRGHGASDKPQADYTDAVFNADLMSICESPGLKHPIAMGHSFGGSTLLHLATDHPDFLSGIVLLDSGVRSAEARTAELKPYYDNPDPKVLKAFLDGRMHTPYDPPELTRRLQERVQPPDYVIKSMRKVVVDFDAATAAANVKLPALFLLSTRHFSDPQTLSRLGPNWLVGQVVASGHWIQLTVPDQVHAMVDRFIAIHWGK